MTNVEIYGSETVVEVYFPRTANGDPIEWGYNAKELAHALELKNLLWRIFRTGMESA